MNAYDTNGSDAVTRRNHASRSCPIFSRHSIQVVTAAGI